MPSASAVLLKSCLAAAALSAGGMAWAWKPEVGESPQPPDQYEYVSGDEVVLAQLKGKPTVLYFGGDWCVPCQLARPSVARLARDHAGTVNVVFFSSDDNRDRAAKQAEERASGYRVAMPRLASYPPGARPMGLKDAGALGRIYSFPTAIVLDAEGKVVTKFERGTPIRNGDLNRYVEGMLR